VRPLTVVANASCLIYLQRRGRLAEFLEREQVVTTERIKQELIDIPLKKVLHIRSPKLRDIVERSAKEIRNFIEQGKIMVEAVDHRRYSNLLDRVKKSIAALEELEEHEVKADHTVVVLTVQVAEKQGPIRVASFDKAINKLIASVSRERGLKIEFMEISKTD